MRGVVSVDRRAGGAYARTALGEGGRARCIAWGWGRSARGIVISAG